MGGCTARGVKMNNYWQSRDVTMYQLMCKCGAMSEEREGQRETIYAAEGWHVRYQTYMDDDYLRILECLCPECVKG